MIQPARGVPLDIHLCFAADQGRQSITLIPNKAANFEVIEDSEYRNIIRHIYNSSFLFLKSFWVVQKKQNIQILSGCIL
jgi:hypothetical protein